jgi:hypothetical protein
MNERASSRNRFGHLAVAVAAMIGLSTAVASPAVAAGSKPKPAVTSFTVSGQSVPASGGPVTLRAAVKRATTCTFSVTPKLKGLPKTVSCAPAKHKNLRTVSRKVSLPANLTATPTTYRFTITAHHGTQKTKRTVKTTVNAIAPSFAGPIGAGPTMTPSTGGTVGFTLSVSAASSCAISVLGTNFANLAGFPKTVACAPAPGTTTAEVPITVTLPSNSAKASVSYSFVVTATGAGGSASETSNAVTVEPVPLPPLTWKVSAVKGETGELTSVSCVSSSFCGASSEDGSLYIFSGGTWHRTAGRLAGDKQPTVSCASTSMCVAVDRDGNETEWRGVTWSQPQVLTDEAITGLSCAPGTANLLCVEVDAGGNASTLTGTQWSASVLLHDTGIGHFVSCPAATFCLEVDADGSYQTYNGHAWSDSALVSNAPKFMSVSCESPTFCTAVTTAGTGYKYVDDTWATAGLTDHAGEKSLDTTYAISCEAFDFCINVDGAGHADYFNGIKWDDLGLVDADPLAAVSCPTSEFCMAVDTHGRTAVGTQK